MAGVATRPCQLKPRPGSARVAAWLTWWVLLTGAMSLAPNEFVLGIDEDRDVMITHQVSGEAVTGFVIAAVAMLGLTWRDHELSRRPVPWSRQANPSQPSRWSRLAVPGA